MKPEIEENICDVNVLIEVIYQLERVYMGMDF